MREGLLMRVFTTCVVCAALLAGCQNPDDPNQARTTSGENLGSAEWKQRYEGERKINLPARVDVEAEELKYRTLPDRYQEYLYTQNFLVMLETLYGIEGFRDQATSSQFRGLFEQYTYDGEPLPTETWDIRYDYPVQYATFEMNGQPCVAAFRTLGDPVGQYKKSSIRGYGCGDADTSMQDYRARATAYFKDIQLSD